MLKHQQIEKDKENRDWEKLNKDLSERKSQHKNNMSSVGFANKSVRGAP